MFNVYSTTISGTISAPRESKLWKSGAQMPFSLQTSYCWMCLVGERAHHVQTVAHVTKSHLTFFQKDWFPCWKWFLGILWVLQVVASIWHKDELLSSTHLRCLGGCSECCSLASDLVALMRCRCLAKLSRTCCFFSQCGQDIFLRLIYTDFSFREVHSLAQWAFWSILKPTKIGDIFSEFCCWQIGFTHLHFTCIVKGSTIGNEPGLVSLALACSCARSSDKS